MRNQIDINSNDNALFVTGQCNNCCIMCAQPPSQKDDLDFQMEKNLALVSAAPLELKSIGITGGEPTLLGGRLFSLIGHIRTSLPDTEIHLLTNGRIFQDIHFVRHLAEEYGAEKILLGIPLHADNAVDHDRITGVKGSFNETMRGLYNLGRFDFGIELRVVITKQNYKRLAQIGNFIYRNLPFVEFISLMGLEYTGCVIKNKDIVWIEPRVYAPELEIIVRQLADWRMDVSVFNLPLCLLPQSIWPYARKSISDWKNVYIDDCQKCSVREMCCGLFGTSKEVFEGINPFGVDVLEE